MKSATPALIALLETNNFYMADLYTFKLVSGVSYYYTTADINITYSGHTFISIDGMFTRNNYKLVKGTEVDTLQITVCPDQTNNPNTLNGIPFIHSAVNGSLDGAIVTLERAFMPIWGDTTDGTVKLFSGKVSDISGDRTSLQINVKSQLELLNIQMPKNLYQAPCGHILYDTGCGLNTATFTHNFTLSTITDQHTLITKLDQRLYPDGYFDQGVIICLTGVNAGTKRTVKSYVGGTATIALSLPNMPSIGDTFSISAGCDKLKSTCQNKFNNLPQFRGFPFVPPPEIARH
jgi:uncharacterized phage protein (TIGR02218 family)